ncbi:hypothetical protein GC090_23205 (plasmid) [Pantoea sp. JZ29]|uniref:hypothetical protein n=1 Tax=Pantoea sp. JZ29 TaxID=2654192 RepID=UPI002B4A14CF|nr:hypothetical protein [Pantoea sp. JZ29]WRH23542.1 hypothetical protein GC090_23205 [Pantoea sp. JZ29]
MKPLLMAGLFLSFSLLLPVDSFASDTTVKQNAEPTPGTIRCIECIKVNVSVWQFKPSDLKAQIDMLISLSKLQSSPVFYGQGSTGGPTVISPGSGQTFIDKIDHLGSLQRRVDWKSVTRSEHPLPLAISSLAGNYSAVITINDWRQFWRPQPFSGLVRFSLRADAPANDNFETLASEGQVFIGNGSEILNMQPLSDGSYIIWIIQANYSG